jgi:hypothetical protein
MALEIVRVQARYILEQEAEVAKGIHKCPSIRNSISGK